MTVNYTDTVIGILIILRELMKKTILSGPQLSDSVLSGVGCDVVVCILSEDYSWFW